MYSYIRFTSNFYWNYYRIFSFIVWIITYFNLCIVFFQPHNSYLKVLIVYLYTYRNITIQSIKETLLIWQLVEAGCLVDLKYKIWARGAGVVFSGFAFNVIFDHCGPKLSNKHHFLETCFSFFYRKMSVKKCL